MKLDFKNSRAGWSKFIGIFVLVLLDFFTLICNFVKGIFDFGRCIWDFVECNVNFAKLVRNFARLISIFARDIRNFASCISNFARCICVFAASFLGLLIENQSNLGLRFEIQCLRLGKTGFYTYNIYNKIITSK